MLIKNVNILSVSRDAKTHTLTKNASIVVKGTKIEKIIDANTPVDDNDVIDGKGKLAIAGLVNTHTHTAMTFLRNYANDMNLQDWLFTKIFPAEDELTAEMAYWCVKLANIEMIKSGVTCYCDDYFFMDEAARSVEETGIRAVLSRSVSGISDPTGAKLQESIDFFKRYHNTCDGRIMSTLGAHAIYTSNTDYIKRVVDAANDVGAGLQTHLSETKTEFDDCMAQHNMTPTRYLDSLGYFDVEGIKIAAHCVHMTNNDIEILKAKDVSVAANISSNLKLASGIAPLPELMAAGVNVTLGTDGASSNNNLSILNEMRLTSLIYKGLSMDPTAMNAKQVISLATSNGARAICRKDLGEIKEGMTADIVLINTDSPSVAPATEPDAALVYSASGADVDTVICNGRVLMNGREVLSADEERAVFEVKRIAEKIVG